MKFVFKILIEFLGSFFNSIFCNIINNKKSDAKTQSFYIVGNSECPESRVKNYK